LKLVFFGTPEFAVLPLQTLLSSNHEILAVVTQPDRQSGRGRHMKPSPVKLEAQKAGIRILQPQSVKDENFISELKSFNPSAIVLVAYGQILPAAIIDLPKRGCINIHASLLPAYRGAAPVNWAIINGEKKTGITIMLMDEGMDTGPVLLQDEIEIRESDTTGTLYLKLSEIGADLLISLLNDLEGGNVTPHAQTGEVSYAPVLKKTDGLLNWSRSAKDICNFIRGMNPWPGAYSYIEGERIKLLSARPTDDNGPEGVIKKISKDELIVSAGNGAVSILELQPSGKPAMPIRAFLQGRKLKEGRRFEIND
jgi:methionyl-tRNA formyltransferase